jgi:hypothetical protein
MPKNLDKQLEKEFKETIRSYFDNKIENYLERNKDSFEVGNNLGELLKQSEADIVKIVTPRAVKKWASKETLPLWEEFLKNEQIVTELREIGKSIANSLRPLAGNNFAIWVTKVLNHRFREENLPLMAVTKGEIKQKLERVFIVEQQFKPDIDIVVADVTKENPRPIVIISAKTTLAERVMQTISWHNHLQNAPIEVRSLKIFLVTAWETFAGDNENKYRVQQLDGVYVCNNAVHEFGKIKLFSKIIEDLKALI